MTNRLGTQWIMISLLCIVPFCCLAQQVGQGKVYELPEVLPEFPGGSLGLYQFLESNLQYPFAAKYTKVQGEVYVKFIINEDGTISNIETTGTPIGGGCEEEAIRVVRAMPKWTPGYINGQAVASFYTLPLRFTFKGDHSDRRTTLSTPDQSPQFPGGNEGLFQYLATNIVIPQEAKDLGIEGTVTVKFIVDAGGMVVNVRTVGPLLGGGCEEEAIRLITQMPKWKPGFLDGEPVNVSYQIPIRFSTTPPGIRDAEGAISPFSGTKKLSPVKSLMDQKKYEEALKRLKAKYRGDPTNPNIALNMGICKLHLNNTKGACKEFKRAAKYGNEDANSFIESYCAE